MWRANPTDLEKTAWFKFEHRSQNKNVATIQVRTQFQNIWSHQNNLCDSQKGYYHDSKQIHYESNSNFVKFKIVVSNQISKSLNNLFPFKLCVRNLI